MATCNRNSESNNTPTASSHNPVFINTNLDTRFATIVSDSDTVSDLKKKIMSEHPQCFPNFGKIEIRSLKVKRRGYFYHLSDSMLVKSAFEGAKKDWFLSVDAFSSKQCGDNQISSEPDASNQLALVCLTKTPSVDLYTPQRGIVSPEFSSGKTGKESLNDVEMANVEVGEEPCNTSYPDTNMRSDLGEIPGTHVELRNVKSSNTNGDVHCNDSLVEASKSTPTSKKKRKRESKGAGNPLEETSEPKARIPENFIVDKLKTTAATSDSLFIETPEDVHLVASSKTGKKKSKKLPRDQVFPAEHSSLHDIGEESCKEHVGVVSKDSDKSPDAAIVSEQNVQHATLLGPSEVPQKQKHPEPVHEVVERNKLPSSFVDYLSTKPPQDVHLVASASSGKKKSRSKKKLPRDQLHAAEPSSLHDLGNDSYNATVGIVAKDSDKASDATRVPELNDQHAILSRTFEVYQKQKDPEPVQDVVEQDKLPSSSGDPLFTKPPEDVHLIDNSSTGKKGSKRKNKLAKDQVVTAEPSSLHDVGKESLKENMVTVAKASEKASDTAIVFEQNVQHATLLGTFEVSQKRKHPDPVQEVVERDKVPSSSIDSFLEPPKDGHLLASSRSGKKKSKRKNKLPTDQMVTAEPSSLLDVVGKESFNENVANVAKDSDKASDAAIVSEQNVQHAAISSGTFEVSQKQKHREPAQEVVERDELPSSSIGINASRPDAANEKEQSYAPELGGQSGSKRRKKSKKHHSTDAKELPSLAANGFDNLMKDVTLSQHENIVPDFHNIETSHPRESEERRELPQNNDPEAMLSEKCEPPIQGGADMHSKESAVSANLLETNIVMESVKSAGNRRVKMRANKSVATDQVMSSMEHGDKTASAISSDVPCFNDDSKGEAKKGESFLSPAERKKIPKPKTVEASFVGASGQSDDMSVNEAESLPLTQENAENMDGNLRKQAKKNETSNAKTFEDFPVQEQTNEVGSFQLNQMNTIQKNAEKTAEKSRRKTKKSQNSAAQGLPDLSIKEQEVGGEELTSSNDRMRDVDGPSKTRRKTKSVKESSKNQLSGQELEIEKYCRNEHGSPDLQQTWTTVDPTQVPSSGSLEDNSIRTPRHNDVDGDAFKNSNMAVSQRDGGRVNFKDYFVAREQTREISPVELVVDKVSATKRSDREVKTKKNAKKVVVPSSATSPDRQNSPKSYVNQGSEKISHGVKAPDSQDAEQIKTTPQESKQLDVVNSCKTSRSVPAYPTENGESSGATSSSSESSNQSLHNKKATQNQSSLDRHHMLVSKASNKKLGEDVKETKHQSSLDRHPATVSKASNKRLGEVVNSSQHEKRLLATPGSIFRDDSSESSEDESGTVNSDTSTRTPSDNSSSSGYSEGESKSNLDSPRKGILEAKGKDGGNSITKSQVNITMDAILRSSSRFKKAKLTATQSQLEDTESQPVDFVPESQPIM